MLSLCDWTTLGAADLRKAGADPAERLNRTGHSSPLNALWSRTVGMWCVQDFEGFLGPGCPLQHVSRRTFDTYKCRHKLRTGSQFTKLEGAGEWRLAATIAGLYHRIQTRRAGLCSLGEPAARIARAVGVLPIEAVLWETVFQNMLQASGATLRDWEQLDDEQKDATWTLGGPGSKPWSATDLYYQIIPEHDRGKVRGAGDVASSDAR